MPLFPVKPPSNRVLVEYIDEPTSIVFVPSQAHMWRGKILRSDDPEFLVGNIIRFQPMKNRYDEFPFEGRRIVSVKKDWIYLKETDAGIPLKTYGNRFVLKMIDAKLFQRKVFEIFSEDFHRAVVICSGKFPVLNVKDVVLIRPSEYWMFYRVLEKWLFVSHASNLIAVDERRLLGV